MFAPIETNRIRLRNLIKDDARTVFSYRSHPEVARFQNWGTDSADSVLLGLQSMETTPSGTPGHWHQVAICLRTTGDLIGDCGFCVLESDPSQVEIGIALNPIMQGNGYAAEALRALLDYLLNKIGKRRVFGSVDPRNARSIALMQRVGMHKLDCSSKEIWLKGESVENVVFAVERKG